MPVGLTPLRLVVAQPPTELGHRRLPRHMVVGFPAVRGLELLPGENLAHAGILEPTLRSQRFSTVSA